MNLELYHRWGCPFSAKVRNFIKEYNHGTEVNMIEVDEVDYSIETLIKLNGKTQVPCLVINGSPLLESKKIIHWMDENLLGSENSGSV